MHELVDSLGYLNTHVNRNVIELNVFNEGMEHFVEVWKEVC